MPLHKKKTKTVNSNEKLYHHPPKDQRDVFSLLTEDVVASILSFTLQYSSVGRALASQHRTITTTCKMFERAAHRLHVGHIRSLTGGRWGRVPRVYTDVVLADVVRLGIHGVTKKTAQKLLLPASILETLTPSVVRLSRVCKAHVYPLGRVMGHLSSLFPTVEEFETALDTRSAAQESQHAVRLYNVHLRRQRAQDIQALLEQLRVDGSFFTPDPRLTRLYVTNGSAKNLRLLEEAAKESRIRQDRVEEVRRLQHQMQATSAQVPAKVLQPYVETGDKGLPWQKVVEWIEGSKLRYNRSVQISSFLAEMGVPSGIMNDGLKIDFIDTGDNVVWSQITSYVTAFLDARLARQHRRQEVMDLAFEMAEHKAWVRQVPMTYWRTHPAVVGYVDRGYPRDTWKDAVKVLFETARRHQFTQENTGVAEATPSLLMYLRDVRRDDLTLELTKHRLRLRPDSKFCSQYIQGTTSASLQEVVATMKLTDYLFTNGGHRGWIQNHCRLENEMRQGMECGKYRSWYDAYDAAKNLARFYDSDSETEFW